MNDILMKIEEIIEVIKENPIRCFCESGISQKEANEMYDNDVTDLAIAIYKLIREK